MQLMDYLIGFFEPVSQIVKFQKRNGENFLKEFINFLCGYDVIINILVCTIHSYEKNCKNDLLVATNLNGIHLKSVENVI